VGFKLLELGHAGRELVDSWVVAWHVGKFHRHNVRGGMMHIHVMKVVWRLIVILVQLGGGVWIDSSVLFFYFWVDVEECFNPSCGHVLWAIA
jgi:hypothetical protein